MTRRAFILFVDPGRPRVCAAGERVEHADVTAPPAATPQQFADAACAALASLGYAGEGLVVAVPSAWCLCAAVRLDDLPARSGRQAMVFRLEEKLPVSAEDVVADFVQGGDRATALGVCVEKKTLSPLVESLERRGIAVEAICPASLLALQYVVASGEPPNPVSRYRRRAIRLTPSPLYSGERAGVRGGADAHAAATDAPHPSPLPGVPGRGDNATAGPVATPDIATAPPDERGPDVLVWPAGEGSLELFTLRGGAPRSWTLLADDPKDLLLHVGLAPLERSKGLNVLAVGLRQPLLDALATLQEVRVVRHEAIPADEAAAATARAVLAGEAEAWVNLRRDDLAVRDRMRLVRAPLAFAAAAVVLCLVSLCGAMLWRAHRYDRLAETYGDRQRAAFRRVFPDQAVPADVPSRLASEARALRGVSGNDASAPPPDSPGLLALRDLITHLPSGVRFRVLDVRLDPGRFTIEGQALSHGDADSIAGALRNNPAFDVEPPRTEQLADPPGDNATAVSFTIRGSVVTGREGQAARGANP